MSYNYCDDDDDDKNYNNICAAKPDLPSRLDYGRSDLYTIGKPEERNTVTTGLRRGDALSPILSVVASVVRETRQNTSSRG